FSVKINKEVLYQAVSYNETIKAKCIILSNGMMHYCLMLNLENKNLNKFLQFQSIKNFQYINEEIYLRHH
ncbi:MAG: type I restriction enzyme HsdR N-terminal domain-containing protein, partial [Cyclobacteriaceae bacterium]|nr:type I restriction enzyme HsdR N-terminal domain-containing protein [Cyclobacteriaceae bacterium]